MVVWGQIPAEPPLFCLPSCFFAKCRRKGKLLRPTVLSLYNIPLASGLHNIIHLLRNTWFAKGQRKVEPYSFLINSSSPTILTRDLKHFLLTWWDPAVLSHIWTLVLIFLNQHQFSSMDGLSCADRFLPGVNTMCQQAWHHSVSIMCTFCMLRACLSAVEDFPNWLVFPLMMCKFKLYNEWNVFCIYSMDMCKEYQYISTWHFGVCEG